MTSGFAMASAAETGGSGELVEVGLENEGGLLFKVIDARTGVQHEFGDLVVGGRWPDSMARRPDLRPRPIQAAEEAGRRLKVTRKYFAVTGAKETVCSGAPPPESWTTRRKVLPSSLASRVLSGAPMPAGAAISRSLLHQEGDGADGLRLRQIRTESRRFADGGNRAAWYVFSRSPSLSRARSVSRRWR